MSEPTPREPSPLNPEQVDELFSELHNQSKSKFAEHLDSFDGSLAELQKIMTDLAKGQGGETIESVINDLEEAQKMVIGTLDIMTNRLLSDPEDSVLTIDESALLWTDIIHKYESDIAEHIQKSSGGKRLTEPTPKVRLLKRARFYTGIDFDIDPADLEHITQMDYEIPEDDEDSDWVMQVICDKLENDIEKFLAFIPPNGQEIKQARRDKFLAIGKEALRATIYVGASVVVSQLWNRRKKN